MNSVEINEDIEKHLDALKKAIALAELQPDVTTYSFAGEKYEELMSLVDAMIDDHRDAMVDVIDDLLPTEWVFWMDAVEKAEMYGELDGIEDSTRH